VALTVQRENVEVYRHRQVIGEGLADELTGQRHGRGAVVVAAAAVAAGLLAARRRAVRAGAGPGAMARRLSDWEPEVLTRRSAQAAAYAWAAPVSLAGLLAGAAAGVRPHWCGGVLVFAGARGPTGWVLRARGFSAGALGHVVIAAQEPSEQLLRHELVHVRQAERLGVLMAPVYLGLLAVYGYPAHPLEVVAYRIAARGPAPA